MSPFLHISGVPQTENGANGKWQLPFVFCRQKVETQTSVCLLQTKWKMDVCFPWLANGKQ
jgi:hypothetical protein